MIVRDESTQAVHLALSGDLGSGKSTVARLLAKELGFELVSTGNVQRSIAARLGLSTLATNLLAEKKRSIDSEVDGVTLELAESARDPIVFDSRMAWHFLPQAFRVRLLVDPDVAVARIVGRDPSLVETYEDARQARRSIRDRFESEVRRFRDRYGVDVTAIDNFDLVLDASDASPEELVSAIGVAYREGVSDALQISPRRIIPVKGARRTKHFGELPRILYQRPFLFGMSNIDGIEAAIASGVKLMDAQWATGGAVGEVVGNLEPDNEKMGVWASKYGVSHDSFATWDAPA